VRWLLVLTILLIVYGSLYPWHFDFSGPPQHPLLTLLDSWPLEWDRFELRDAAINILLYVPFGAALVCLLARRLPGWLALAPVLIAAALLSSALEMLQVYLPGRVCSLFDVTCNTAGAGVGAVAALASGLTRLKPTRSKRGALGAWLLLLAWLGFQLYPFFPVISQSRVRLAISELASLTGFVPHEVWCGAAEWWAAMLLVATAIESIGAPALRRMPPQLVLLCLPLRWVVVTRTEALHEVIGGALACMLWMAIRPDYRLRVGVWMLASGLLLRELAPFHFTATPSGFNWIPFVPSFDSERHSALVILLRKAFDYGAMVWLLVQTGTSHLRAGAAVTVTLIVLEAMQRYLPGRTPETTDAVLASLMTLILWILRNFERRQGLA